MARKLQAPTADRPAPKGVWYRGPLQWRWVVRARGIYAQGVELDEASAQIARENALTLIRAGRWQDHTRELELRDLAVCQAIDRYAAQATRLKDSAKAVAELRNLAERVKAHLAELGMERRCLDGASRLRKADMIAYRDARLQIVSPQTVAHEMQLVSQVFKSGEDWGLEDLINPTRGRDSSGRPLIPRPPKRGRRTPRARRFSSAEITSLVQALADESKEAAEIFLLALGSGLRRGQLIELRRSWVNWDLKIVQFPDRPPDAAGEVLRLTTETRSKNFKGQRIPLATSVVEFLKSLDKRGDCFFTLSLDEFGGMFRRAVRAAGVKSCGIHTTRHHFNSLLLDAGLDPEQRALVLAQYGDLDELRPLAASVNIRHYSHYIDENIRQKLEAAVSGIKFEIPVCESNVVHQMAAEIARLRQRAIAKGKEIKLSDRQLVARLVNGRRGGRPKLRG